MSFSYSPWIKNKIYGFTLVEVLVTVSVISVLLMLAAPSLQELFIKNKIRKISNDFTSSIFKSRNLAVNKNVCTIMCISDNTGSASPTCSTSGDADWQKGWIVFINPECDTAVNAPAIAENIFEIRQTADIDYLLTVQGSSPVRKISFNARGANFLVSAMEIDLIYKTVNNPLTNKLSVNICLDALGRTRTIPSLNSCSSYK